MARALITGIDGFTGRYLAEELRSADYDVFGLAVGGSRKKDDGILIVDLNDIKGVETALNQVHPDVIVHLAAISFVAHGDVEAIYRTNVMGTRNLLEAASKLKMKPRAILLASSANIYGNAIVEKIDETVPAKPNNDYAVSKLAMEYMAHLWIDKLPITFVRPFNYTGVGQSVHFLLPKIVDHFKRRAPVMELGNIDVIRDFSDVRTVVACYRRLLECDTLYTSGEIFNICSGVGYSLQDAIEIMREFSGYSPEIRVNPTFVRANEVKRLIGSCAKLESVIGTMETIRLRDTLRWMY
jgi:GDP-6-deoxy-D-talose 4-dehydrogenase